MQPVLSLEKLKLSIGTGSSGKEILSEITLSIQKGEILALVGESGSGKSMTVRAITRLDDSIPGYSVEGKIEYHGAYDLDILDADSESLSKFRNENVGIIFQQSKNVLNPSQKIGKQITEKLRIRNNISDSKVQTNILELLDLVELHPADRFSNSYPHQLSGGQLQRCLIALAMANNPEILLADEPVSALDEHLKTEILQLILKLKSTRNISVLLISHDLELIGQISDRIAIIQDGRIVETGSKEHILTKAETEYTRSLLACRPSREVKTNRLATMDDFIDDPELTREKFYRENMTEPEELEKRNKNLEAASELIELKSVSKSYSSATSIFKKDKLDVLAVKNVSMSIKPGEILGLCGPSGSGKSTLARLISFMEFPERGEILFKGKDVQNWNENELASNQRKIQIIFQDPLSVMPPHITVRNFLNEVLTNSEDPYKTIAGILGKVGLDDSHLYKTPTMLSGGERQRVIIARSLLLEPELLICDEILSALDVSVQAQVINLLLQLNREEGLTILFISHDLNMVNFISDRVINL